uniref:BEACH domain-containing protein n=1 Tax=Schistocephalus solidus TaxID=70667 RepID=A0A183SBN3_SCHSO
LRHSVDGGVTVGGELVENASEVLSPTLEDLRLLSELGSSVSTEKRTEFFDGGTVESLDGNEEVLPFFASRIPLYLLGLVNHLAVLQFLQLQLS